MEDRGGAHFIDTVEKTIVLLMEKSKRDGHPIIDVLTQALRNNMSHCIDADGNVLPGKQEEWYAVSVLSYIMHIRYKAESFTNML